MATNWLSLKAANRQRTKAARKFIMRGKLATHLDAVRRASALRRKAIREHIHDSAAIIAAFEKTYGPLDELSDPGEPLDDGTLAWLRSADFADEDSR